jgi:hypothetical protein
VRVPGQVIPAVHVIDWAADPEFPGAGIWLLRHIGAKVDYDRHRREEITRRILLSSVSVHTQSSAGLPARSGHSGRR